MKFSKKIAAAVAGTSLALGAAAALPSAAHAAPRPAALQTAAAAGRALPPGLTAVKAGPNALGPGWTAVAWKAEVNGGYVAPSGGTFQPVVSSTKEYTWYERSVGAVPRHGTAIELVNAAGTLAVGWSSPYFVTLTPDSSSTWVVWDTSNGCDSKGGFTYCPVGNSGFSNFAAPNGNGDPLKTPGSETQPADGWGFPGE